MDFGIEPTTFDKIEFRKIVLDLIERCQARGVIEPSVLDGVLSHPVMESFFRNNKARAVKFIRYLETKGIEILDEDIDQDAYRSVPMVITIGNPIWAAYSDSIIGKTFNFPNRYRDMVLPGRPFVYYQHTPLTSRGKELRGYIGIGIINDVRKDSRHFSWINRRPEVKWCASIRNYRMLERIVYWTNGIRPIEEGLEERDWIELVRDLSLDTYTRILEYEYSPVITELQALPIVPEQEERLRAFERLLEKFEIDVLSVETGSPECLTLPKIDEVVSDIVETPQQEVSSQDFESTPKEVASDAVEVLDIFDISKDEEVLAELKLENTASTVVVMPDIKEVSPSTAGSSFLIALARVRVDGGTGELKKVSPRGPGSYRRSRNSTIIGNRAEEVVFRLLQKESEEKGYRSVRWVSRDGEKPGWDIEIMDKEGVLQAVEVKGTSGKFFPSIEVTAQEWQAAEDMGDNFSLFLVTECIGRNPKVQQIKNPVSLVRNGTFSLSPLVWKIELLSVGKN